MLALLDRRELLEIKETPVTRVKRELLEIKETPATRVKRELLEIKETPATLAGRELLEVKERRGVQVQKGAPALAVTPPSLFSLPIDPSARITFIAAATPIMHKG